MQWLIQKEGELNIRSEPGAPFAAPRGKKYKYAATISSPSLDGRTFVVDHVDVDDRLHDVVRGTRFNHSAEMVALYLAQVIAGLIGDRLNKYDAKIRLSLTGGATCTVEGSLADINRAEVRRFDTLPVNVTEASALAGIEEVISTPAAKRTESKVC